MATTPVDICNIALYRANTSARIESLNENSEEAAACSVLYDDSRKITLSQYDWGFARSYITLAEYGTNPTEWNYQYKRPNNCIAFREIVRTDPSLEDPIPFEVGLYDGVTRVVWTNRENATGKFTADIASVPLFDPLFVDAMAWHMVSEFAPSLTGSSEIAQMAQEMFRMSLSRAKAVSGNEGESRDNLEAEWIRGR